jgi:3-methyl-2-oxobutanoate hydroxymethyltransferase
MGHVGLTPQSASALGGFRAQGRTARQAVQVADDALALQDAGCFAVVFEAVPAAVTETIMARMTIPVIGIGAGAATDGQVLVFHDLLGIYDGHAPRFTKRFADVRQSMVEGVQAFAEEVRERRFPSVDHTYGIDPGELARFQEIVAPGKPWDAADALG